MRHLDELMSRWQEGADVSFARTNFAEKAEAAINDQVGVLMGSGGGGGGLSAHTILLPYLLQKTNSSLPVLSVRPAPRPLLLPRTPEPATIPLAS
jgi:hypothetical protein